MRWDYRALSWKMTYKDKASYDSTPCTQFTIEMGYRADISEMVPDEMGL